VQSVVGTVLLTRLLSRLPRPGAHLAGCERINTAGRERAPFLTWGNAAAASCLLNKLGARGITEELVDDKVLLKGAYSEVDQPAVRSIGKRTPDHWSERASMTAVLFLSLGLWVVIWEAAGSLVSAVLR
jgi:hypothetical protein